MTEAVLRDVGTVEVSREELIIDVMIGKIEGRQVLARAEGMGSSRQEEFLDLLMSIVISSADEGWKVDRMESGGANVVLKGGQLNAEAEEFN